MGALTLAIALLALIMALGGFALSVYNFICIKTPQNVRTVEMVGPYAGIEQGRSLFPGAGAPPVTKDTVYVEDPHDAAEEDDEFDAGMFMDRSGI